MLKWVHEEFEEKVLARGGRESEGSDTETERGFGLRGYNAYAVEAYRLRLERLGLDDEGQADEASAGSSSEATQGYVTLFFLALWTPVTDAPTDPGGIPLCTPGLGR